MDRIVNLLMLCFYFQWQLLSVFLCNSAAAVNDKHSYATVETPFFADITRSLLVSIIWFWPGANGVLMANHFPNLLWESLQRLYGFFGRVGPISISPALCWWNLNSLRMNTELVLNWFSFILMCMKHCETQFMMTAYDGSHTTWNRGRPSVSVLYTLVGIQAKQGVLAAKADAERPASRGCAFGVWNLHEVDVTVDGNKIHTAQRVGANASLSEGRPHLVPQLQGKLEENRLEMQDRRAFGWKRPTSTHNDFMSLQECYLLIAADAPANTLQLGVADLPELVLWHRYNSVTLRDQLAAVPNKEAVISWKCLQDL